MPAYTGSNPSGTYHTSGGQTVKPSRKGTTVYVPPHVAASKPAGGSVVHTSGAPGAGVTQTITRSASGTVSYGPTHAPSKGLSRSQVRAQDARARVAAQAQRQAQHQVAQAQHNLAKIAKAPLIHALNKAGTIANKHELQQLKVAKPQAVIAYAHKFNPDVAKAVIEPLKQKFPNLPSNQAPAQPKQLAQHQQVPRQLLNKGTKRQLQKQAQKPGPQKPEKKAKLKPGGTKKKARVLPTAAGFSRNAQVFDAILAKKTGRSPEFIASWMKHEEDPTQSAASPAGPGNQDWLAVGFPGHRTSISQQPAFDKPGTAAKATYKYLKGKLPNYQAPSDITNAILGSKTDAQAGAALSQTNYAGAPGVYNPADLMSTISRTKIKLKHGVAGAPSAQPAKITKKGPLVHPFPHATIGRTDMGVDFTGTGPIRAMGNGKIIRKSAPGWPNGGAGPAGQGIAYTLTDGPLKGKAIYVNEGITVNSALGTHVKKGQVIGRFYPGSSIETGFADSTGQPTDASTYTEGQVTQAGTAMRNLLTGKTVKLGTASGGSFTGTASVGAPAGVSGAVAPTSTPSASVAPSATTTTRNGRTVVQRQGLTRKQQAHRKAVQMAEQKRRAVLHAAISALGAKAPAAPKTSAPAAPTQKKIELGLSG